MLNKNLCFRNRLLAKKSIMQVQSEAQNLGLKRTMGKWNLLSLGIGCIIGAGIFVMVGEAAGSLAGPAVILSFLFTAIACGFAGLCYAEMASVLPVSGSAYTYAYTTMGEFCAWLIGAFLILEYGLAASTVAVGWSGYFTSFLSEFGLVIPPYLTQPTGTIVTLADGTQMPALMNLPAIGGILFLTAFLVKGMSESVTLNNIIVSVKLLVVLGFIIIGAFYIDPSNWTPFIPERQMVGDAEGYGWQGIFAASSLIFFAYLGFESVSTAAAEAKDPQKDMPFGMLGSLLVCTILYMLLAGVLTGVINYKELIGAEAPLALAADTMGIGWFKIAIKIGALFGLTSVMLVLMYAMTRVFFMISKDGLLPKFMSDIHPYTLTPVKNTLCVGVISAIAAGTLNIKILGSLVSMGTLLAFIVVCASVLYLKKHHPELHRPFNTPFKPVVPILGIVTCGFLIANMHLETFIYFGVYLILAIIAYFSYGYRNSRLQKL